MRKLLATIVLFDNLIAARRRSYKVNCVVWFLNGQIVSVLFRPMSRYYH
jgi:hypothetical protein